MTPRIREKHKVPGVAYAVTDDGLELPVVDITHPAFVLEPTAGELARLEQQSLGRIKKTARLPRFLVRLFARQSIIVRGSMAASGSFVSGMTTYLMKLGPDNLNRGYAGRLDRRIAASLSPVCIRLRLRDTARVLADALAPPLAARTGPLHLLNIAGGVAVDCLDALILLQQQHPELLAKRSVLVQVLDIDRAAPTFGARALGALRAPGAPLHGLEARFEQVEHDWNEVERLGQLLLAIDPEAVVAITSEGGLFEYGSDQAITGNLATLRDRTPADSVLVGSMMLDAPTPRAITANGGVANRLFSPEAFEALVGSSGWAIARVAHGNPIYRVVAMEKAAPRPTPAAEPEETSRA